MTGEKMNPIKDLLPTIEGDPVNFDTFWQAYPRKQSKPAAQRAWDKLSQADQLAAVKGVIHHKEHNPQWRDKTLIPHAATFLNGRRWEDEIVQPRKDEIEQNVKSIPDLIWSMGVQFFGQSWITKHGDRPGPAWNTACKLLTQQDVSRGLRNLIDAGEANPPSLPRFIQVCKTNQLPEWKQLPRPQGDPAKAEAAFEEMRRIIKG